GKVSMIAMGYGANALQEKAYVGTHRDFWLMVMAFCDTHEGVATSCYRATLWDVSPLEWASEPITGAPTPLLEQNIAQSQSSKRTLPLLGVRPGIDLQSSPEAGTLESGALVRSFRVVPLRILPKINE